jgi:hypothetical protein
MSHALSLDPYFSVALPEILRRQGAGAIAVGRVVRFVVTGRGGGAWTLRLRPPVACVVRGAEWKADLVIKITLKEMHNILRGTFNAREAIAAGNIEMAGDLSLMRAIGFLFAAPAVVTALPPTPLQPLRPNLGRPDCAAPVEA